MAELRLSLGVELGEAPRLQTRDVLVQRIDEDGERQVVLELPTPIHGGRAARAGPRGPRAP